MGVPGKELFARLGGDLGELGEVSPEAASVRRNSTHSFEKDYNSQS